MRKAALSFLLLCLCLALAAVDPFSYECKTVFIDPGHGGYDPGSVSASSLEKDINLSVALALRGELEREGLNVVMTRSKDVFVSLEERSQAAYQADYPPDQSAIFVSIHVNASESSQASGFEVYSMTFDSQRSFFINGMSPLSILRFGSLDSASLSALVYEHSCALASSVLEAFTASFPDRRNRGLKEADYAVLIGSRMPSVLVELGFISNDKERQWLERRAKEMANALAKGILDYIGGL
jgi:N-acetylmuramoyl-L-alanine amidase